MLFPAAMMASMPSKRLTKSAFCASGVCMMSCLIFSAFDNMGEKSRSFAVEFGRAKVSNTANTDFSSNPMLWS